MTISNLESTDTTVAEIKYLDPYSRVSGLFVAPGVEVDAGSYTPYPVSIRNGRPVRERFTLEENAFAFVEQRCPIDDFTDKELVDAVYVPAALELVKETLGADAILPVGWIARTGTNVDGTAAQPPASQVHCDVSAPSGARRFAEEYATHFPGAEPYTRAVMTSFWRVINEPPQDWPLAICDFRSVQAHEGVLNPLVFLDEVPADPVAAAAALNLDEVRSGTVFYYDPKHEWWYFPEMTRDEALLFKLNDTDQSVAWRAPHTAFFDPTVSAGHTRHSIEFRSIAYFR